MLDFFGSLRFRAMAVTVLAFAALFLLVITNTNKLLDDIALQTVQSNIRQTSETMNLAIAPYTTAEGLETLQDYIGELISGGEVAIVYLAIVDEQGNVVLQTDTTPDFLPEPTPPDALLKQNVVHIAQPTLLYGNQIGMLRFGMTWSRLKSGIEELNNEIYRLLSVGFVLLGMLIFYLVFRITRRLSALVEVSQQLGSGDYQVRAICTGHDEITKLGDHFNSMAQAIAEHIRHVETSRRKVEELNASLEDRVIERTNELASALDNLKKTQHELIQSEKLAGLGSIVAAVAHELNTPIGNALTVATSFAEKTRQFNQDVSSGLKRSTLNNYIDSVISATELLERNLGKAAELILSFKHVAIDQTSSKRREFDLAETIREIVSTVSPTFRKTGYSLDLDLHEGISMQSYPGAIGQIITNFINNAIRHGFAGRDNGCMSLSCVLETEGWVKIRFSDDGLGVSAENLKHIFDPFFTTQLGKGGSGLGLNIVHNIVTGLLGGSIVAESQPGEGTTFNIIVPLKAPEGGDDGVDAVFRLASGDAS